MVASIILGFALKFIVDQRKFFVEDRTRTQIYQNLRTAMDLVGTDIRQAGESLPANPPPWNSLPVVQVNNGASGTPDELVLQRKEPEWRELVGLPVCRTINAGAATGANSTIDVSIDFSPANTSDCQYNNNDADAFPDNLQPWRDARCNRDGTAGCVAGSRVVTAIEPKSLMTNDICTAQGSTGTGAKECLWAYIYDPVNQRGEFFHYAFEDSYVSGTRTRYRIYRAPSSTRNSWQYTYTYTAPTAANPNPINPIIYILEERRYRLINNPDIAGDKVLELTLLNQDATESTNTFRLVDPIRIANQLSNFQLMVNAITNPTTGATTPLDSFPVTNPTAYNWQNRTLKSIRVDLTAINPSSDAITVPNTQLNTEFFPRNALNR